MSIRRASRSASVDDRRPPARSRSSSDSVGEPSALGRGEDRGQRGAQVVRDGAQQRGLELVAAAQRARLDDLALQRLALERRGEQRLERRDDALLQALERASDGVARAPAACRAGASPSPQREGDAGARRPSTGAQLDRRRRQLERLRQPVRGRGQSARRGSAPPSSRRAISAARSASRRRCSASVARARRALGERAGDERGDEEDAERDPVLAVGDREAPGRRDVEEVERQRALASAVAAPSQRAPDARDQQDGEQVDDAERDDRARPRAAGRRAPVVAATASAATTAPTSGYDQRPRGGESLPVVHGIKRSSRGTLPPCRQRAHRGSPCRGACRRAATAVGEGAATVQAPAGTPAHRGGDPLGGRGLRAL